jgi:hypothetical protein
MRVADKGAWGRPEWAASRGRCPIRDLRHYLA